MGIGKSILAGLAIDRLGKQMQESEEESATETEVDKSMPKESPDRTVPVQETGDKMDQLIATQQKSNPSPEAIDGFDSTTVTIPAGGTAIIRTRPRSGLKLKVRKIHFDRFEDFKYDFLIDGEQFGGENSNEIEFESPRIVSGEGAAVSIATNESSTERTLDWYIRSWGEVL